MGYGSLVSLVFHNLPSLYPSSFCRNDFSYLLYVCVCVFQVCALHNTYCTLAKVTEVQKYVYLAESECSVPCL